MKTPRIDLAGTVFGRWTVLRRTRVGASAGGFAAAFKEIIMDEISRLAISAREELTRLGILEDSGQRRPDPAGVMQVVWQLSPLGHMVGECKERLGLTFEQALAMVTGDATGEVKH